MWLAKMVGIKMTGMCDKFSNFEEPLNHMIITNTV